MADIMKMGKCKDLTGRRFGRLIVLSITDKRAFHRAVWVCQCDCGNIVEVSAGRLLSSHTKSCGCLQKARATESHIKHGKSETRLYSIWAGMIKRCTNEEAKNYMDYGGRGITVCDEWRNSFEVFYEWAMANGYSDQLTIDREDNNKGYSPENCRWITHKEQNNNRRSNRNLTYNGETHNMKEWASIVGINYRTLQNRINQYGWDVEKALTTPIQKRRNNDAESLRNQPSNTLLH